MKKYLALFLGVLFVFGFAATAFAIHAEIPSESTAVISPGDTQITLGGEIRFRGEIRANNGDFNNNITTDTVTGFGVNSRTQEGAYYDMRVRLSLDAKVTPNTEGYVMLETGNADNSDTINWGTCANQAGTNQSGGSGLYGGTCANSQRGSMQLMQAWILHQGSGLLGVPALVKVGHMPIKFGNGLFLDHSRYGDDAILLGVDPIKNMHIIAGTIKLREGNVSLSDDADGYAVLFNYDFDKLSSVSFDITYVNDQHEFLSSSYSTGILPNDGQYAHLWNFGLRGNTEIAGFGMNADLEVQAGKIGNTLAAGLPFNVNSLSIGGYAGTLGFYYKIAPVKLMLDGAYGSGANNLNDIGKTFVTTLGNDQHFSYVYEYSTVNAANRASGGLENTWYVHGGVTGDIVKDLTGELHLYYLEAIKTSNIAQTYGFAYNTTSHNIGFEIDPKITWAIDRNLKYWVEGGYLFAGNFWHAVTGPNKSPDGAYCVRNGFQINF